MDVNKNQHDIVRRAAERGRRLAEHEIKVGRLDPRGHLDMYQHILDELERFVWDDE